MSFNELLCLFFIMSRLKSSDSHKYVVEDNSQISILYNIAQCVFFHYNEVIFKNILSNKKKRYKNYWRRELSMADSWESLHYINKLKHIP